MIFPQQRQSIEGFFYYIREKGVYLYGKFNYEN